MHLDHLCALCLNSERPYYGLWNAIEAVKLVKPRLWSRGTASGAHYVCEFRTVFRLCNRI